MNALDNQPSPPITPGYKTTEFWTTALLQVVNVLVTAGVIPVKDSDTLKGQISAASLGIAAIVSLVLYIKGRVDLKSRA